ncbi:crotonase/enoyl-CoA hydratase family protein [Paraburkholderia acidisoli]|uniref:Crotonase/enoyl-CoA hydratase family protein n=1 Tax=Paraburkholderia acidisoli TaxID=2571748 RepID=A0A7Z2GK90_9BURK|nr:crotonase/enoyl-CoA hydratase family protein [Paraburkholderia acidisoli]QGZ63345.1 crotonase/enoyl-CoA hydratase family protein [Paraburkholderia acidisoli]
MLDTDALQLTVHEGIAHLTLNRPAKRNAINTAQIEALDAAFRSLGEDIHAVLLTGAGEHFCAGLDLAENSVNQPVDVLRISQRWHKVFHDLQFSGKPVVAVLQGGVIGGGLELALAAHVRVAERSAFFQLPEGRRGIFVGGGASVRVARIIGADRMTEMMLTGRRYTAEEGCRLGLAHYLAEPGDGLRLATELARTIAQNSALSNWACIQAVSRIHDMSMQDGLFTESLTAALLQSTPEARERMEAFLTGKTR